MPKEPTRHYSRPADTSLAAFKAWINSIAEFLDAIDDDAPISEEEWERDWRKFWAARGES